MLVAGSILSSYAWFDTIPLLCSKTVVFELSDKKWAISVVSVTFTANKTHQPVGSEIWTINDAFFHLKNNSMKRCLFPSYNNTNHNNGPSAVNFILNVNLMHLNFNYRIIIHNINNGGSMIHSMRYYKNFAPIFLNDVVHTYVRKTDSPFQYLLLPLEMGNLYSVRPSQINIFLKPWRSITFRPRLFCLYFILGSCTFQELSTNEWFMLGQRIWEIVSSLDRGCIFNLVFELRMMWHVLPSIMMWNGPICHSTLLKRKKHFGK